MNNKPIWQSKTFWANVITTLVGVLGVLAGADWIRENLKMVAGIATATGVLNILLRIVTVEPVSLFLLLLCITSPAWGQTIDPEWASYRISVPGAAGSATGIAPDLAVTNVHVVERQGNSATLRHPLSGREWKGQAVALDRSADVALVQMVITSEPLDWVQMGDDPQTGQSVVHLGYGGGQGTLRRGEGQYLGAKGFQSRGAPVWHASTQSISGDSGGGLFDSQGRLCSVNWGSSPSEGEISLSTPVSYVRNLLTQFRGGPQQPIAQQPRQPRGRGGAPPPKSPVTLGPRRSTDPLAGFDVDLFVGRLVTRFKPPTQEPPSPLPQILKGRKR